ncbi:class I SAM-dependent methyltransferase [Algibacter sp. PT7-4]|uniref:class I SAM-dependent methyltransferase n=1 Tax=Algibacter ulvanivorans TaxID=3400999 RepID=UPI003AAD8B05
MYNNSRGNLFLENYVCDSCGFVYTYPRISNEEVNHLYLDGAFSKEARKSSKPDLNKFIQTESWALERLHLLEQKIPDFFLKTKTCLEIGCGTGSFLWLLKSRDNKVKGIEPDSEFVNVAVKRYGIDVDTILFDDSYSPKLYDFICSFHVIEHVLNPRSFVKNIYRRLNANGSVYIECPTIDNIYTNDLNTFFWNVHVNTFSNKSLPWLLESEGFTVSEVFMNRGFVAVIATKGDVKSHDIDNKNRVKNIITDFKAQQLKEDKNKKLLSRVKNKLKSFLK